MCMYVYVCVCMCMYCIYVVRICMYGIEVCESRLVFFFSRHIFYCRIRLKGGSSFEIHNAAHLRVEKYSFHFIFHLRAA
jgi:hypothetical protein